MARSLIILATAVLIAFVSASAATRQLMQTDSTYTACSQVRTVLTGAAWFNLQVQQSFNTCCICIICKPILLITGTGMAVRWAFCIALVSKIPADSTMALPNFDGSCEQQLVQV